MDIASISKVANRKKINNEAQKLRDKLNRKTSDVIKLKVAQDTVYWDLKEKYHQLEGNHVKLQQNMVELQMQHEDISGQYQEALRLRPDTLNKVQTTHELATVLEQYIARLKNTFSKCASDKNALSQAFTKSAALVKEMNNIQNDMEEVYRRKMDELGAMLKKETAHHTQLTELHESVSKRDKEEIADLTSRATSLKEGIEKTENELRKEKNRVDELRNELENKERMVTELQTDMRRLKHEVEARKNKLLATVAKGENEKKLNEEKLQSLETALKNQEQLTDKVKSENVQLQHRLTAAEEETERLKKLLQLKQLTIQESKDKIEKLTSDVSHAEAFRTQLEDIIQEQEKALELKSLEVSTLTDRKTAVENEKLLTDGKVEDLSTKNRQLDEEKKQLQEKVQEREEMMVQWTKDTGDMEKSYEDKLTELTVTFEKVERELSSKVEELGRLMNDAMVENERAAQLQHEVAKLTTEKQEKEDTVAMWDKANVLLTDKIMEKLQSEIQARKATINNIQKAVTETTRRDVSSPILLQAEMDCNPSSLTPRGKRNNQKKLQSEIQARKTTINNIQKAVTGTARRHVRSPIPIQAEMDHNAVSLTPRGKHNNQEKLQSEIQARKTTINNIQKAVTGTARRHVRSPILPQAEMDQNAVSLTPRSDRNNQEKLQSEIQARKTTINNIQKAVTGTARRHVRSPIPIQAEMDHNAVSLTPRGKHNNQHPQKVRVCDSPTFTAPKSKEAPQKTSSVYDFNSDSSVDGDFNFRSALRGVRRPPLKRRAEKSSRAQGKPHNEDVENKRHRGRKFFKTERK